jgi:hypothetical protein
MEDLNSQGDENTTRASTEVSLDPKINGANLPHLPLEVTFQHGDNQNALDFTFRFSENKFVVEYGAFDWNHVKEYCTILTMYIESQLKKLHSAFHSGYSHIFPLKDYRIGEAGRPFDVHHFFSATDRIQFKNENGRIEAFKFNPSRPQKQDWVIAKSSDAFVVNFNSPAVLKYACRGLTTRFPEREFCHFKRDERQDVADLVHCAPRLMSTILDAFKSLAMILPNPEAGKDDPRVSLMC